MLDQEKKKIACAPAGGYTVARDGKDRTGRGTFKKCFNNIGTYNYIVKH